MGAGEVVVLGRVGRRRVWYLDLWGRLVRQKPLALVGLVLVVGVGLMALLADVIAPYGYNEVNLRARYQGPSLEHWLGTDQLGRDLFTRVIYGARVSLAVGFGAMLIGVVLAVALGVVSGFFGGKLDILIQRFVDTWMAFPWLVLLLTIMSLVGPGLLNMILVLGVTFGIQNSRVFRGVTLSLKQNQYVEAARAVGAGEGWIILRHILPNLAPTAIVIASIGLGNLILAEASISFLGYGVPPPYPTWGGMLSLTGLAYMKQSPWIAIWPGVFLALTVYGFNMFGDGLRDLLDPKLRGLR